MFKDIFAMIVLCIAGGVCGAIFHSLYISKHCEELNSFYANGKVFYCKVDREIK